MNIEMILADKKHIDDIFETEKVSFTDPWTRQGLENALDDSIGIFLAAVCDEKAVGYIIGTCDGFSGYIEKTAVSPDYRRMGIGDMLLEAFEKHMLPSADSISLEVRMSNTAARALYEKKGFSDAGVRREFYSSPKEDALVMIKNIGEGECK